MEKKLIERAREEYDGRETTFDELVSWSLENGFLISEPSVFCAGYFSQDCEKTICTIIYCIGDLDVVLRHSINYMIDFFEFERRFSGKTKRYSAKRLIDRALKWDKTHQ